jgi:hypothetical protein
LGRAWRNAAGVGLSIALLVLALPASAASNKALRQAGNILIIALPASAVGVTLLHKDWKGLGEFVFAAGLTVGSAYALRQLIHERRPDHSDFQSMSPPDLALADSAGDYLWNRYGWRYGVPAYVGRFVVSYALSDARKNHWYDTLASGALAYGFNYAFVTRYRRSRVHVAIEPEPGGASLRISMNL